MNGTSKNHAVLLTLYLFDMEEKLRLSKTFRYEISESERRHDTVLYVLHGYGQMPQYFIRKFSFLFDDYLVVAPEGMHRFYLEGSSGRVGASWMTKEAREDDISDTVDWLNALDDRISRKYQPKRKIVLGFSQGGAAAARWQHNETTQFDAAILWASVFPPDLDPNKEISNRAQRYFAIGENDQFYNGAAQNDIIAFYEEKGFNIQTFKGTHDIDKDALLSILEKINRRALQR